MKSTSESRYSEQARKWITQITGICILLLIIKHYMSIESTTTYNSVKSVSSSKSVIQTSNGQGVYKNGISKLQQQLNQLDDYVNNKKRKLERVLVENEIMVYPNPATTEITIEYNFDKGEVADFVIFDMLGREHLRTKLYGNILNTKVSTVKLLPGIYLYKISKGDGSNFTGKLTIE